MKLKKKIKQYNTLIKLNINNSMYHTKLNSFFNFIAIIDSNINHTLWLNKGKMVKENIFVVKFKNQHYF